MAFADSFKNIMGKIGQGPLKKEGEGISQLGNGGFTGFHMKVDPNAPKPPKAHFGLGKKKQQAQPNVTAQQSLYQEPLNSTGYQPRNAAFASNQAPGVQPQGTGYRPLGTVAPQGNYQFQSTGFQGQQTDYQFQNNTGFQQRGGTGFQQPQPVQPMGTGFQAQQPNGTGFQTPAQQPAAMGAATQEGNREGSNISYINVTFQDQQGNAYFHVERILSVTNTAQCYRLIEFMRHRESVMVNVEDFDDERERQRCLDLLFGAAFSMNCSFVRIAKRSVYLIAPQGVYVATEPLFQQMTQDEKEFRWHGSVQPQPGQDRVHGTYMSYGERYAR